MLGGGGEGIFRGTVRRASGRRRMDDRIEVEHLRGFQ